MTLNLYVERDHGRRGVAQELMQAMLLWCRGHDFVSVARHATDAGRALYQRLGFKPTNEMQLDLDLNEGTHGENMAPTGARSPWSKQTDRAL